MRRIYRVTNIARDDLDSIATEVGTSSPAAAEAILDRLFDTFLLLAEHPEIGTLRTDLGTEVRVFAPQKPARHYLVFYFPIPNGVAIIGIVHGARDWISLFQSEDRIDKEQS
jgi:toxin ParE1/3/4